MTTAMMTIRLLMHATLLMYNYLFSPICGSMNAYSLQLVGCSLRNDYPNLFNGESGRTKRALEAASTPSGAFFFFMRPDLWEDIAADSNNYLDQPR
ncbi:hypothetical protein JG688_00000224 [Phytophthora aleatoria]|uniref:Secreted protein n=1 Tax=Phytophthora aleatoria TaxID=2496075 RepID=A0A8J5J3H4_9STRA|nr:hypothetical protein JG688_00000224 [Phytophthora aleatoria]